MSNALCDSDVGQFPLLAVVYQWQPHGTQPQRHLQLRSGVRSHRLDPVDSLWEWREEDDPLNAADEGLPVGLGGRTATCIHWTLDEGPLNSSGGGTDARCVTVYTWREKILRQFLIMKDFVLVPIKLSMLHAYNFCTSPIMFLVNYTHLLVISTFFQ